MSKNAALDPACRDDIRHRLGRAEGQTRGIRKMILKQERCIAVLQQVAALKAATASIRHVLFKFHVEHGVIANMIGDRDADAVTLAELADLVSRLSR
jgi:DNA-binding FrmR family transcriptional regulator